MHKRLYFIIILILSSISSTVFSSGKMDSDDIKDVKRAEISSEEEKQLLSIAAGHLADYEFAAKKLINSLQQKAVNAEQINKQANKLLALSETVIDSARFRLPQCDDYLGKTLAIKDKLDSISLETIESDYHHDGALPKAPGECYHAKDLFVHPATVVILARIDPSLGQETRTSISAEITEVIAHTELVRQLVIY